jgi:hypothetical protein
MPTIPRPSKRTLREFAFQIATIIAGILIALWVDNLVEARRERAVVRDAHAAIAREIAENLKVLTDMMPALDEHERALRNSLRFADDLRQRGKTDIRTLNIGVVFPSLSRASWQSAERTGALGYMAFADVKAYAGLYDLQDIVVTSQRQQFARISDATARAFAGKNGDPLLMQRSEVEAFRDRVLDALGGATIHKAFVTQLVEAYKKAPQR